MHSDFGISFFVELVHFLKNETEMYTYPYTPVNVLKHFLELVILFRPSLNHLVFHLISLDETIFKALLFF